MVGILGFGRNVRVTSLEGAGDIADAFDDADAGFAILGPLDSWRGFLPGFFDEELGIDVMPAAHIFSAMVHDALEWWHLAQANDRLVLYLTSQRTSALSQRSQGGF
jgi:hypothetical protein